MKIVPILISTFFIIHDSYAQFKPKAILKDFQKAEGRYQGTLTYLDYSSGKPYTMPANIEITQIKKTNQFIFSNAYPKEKSANSLDTMTISNDGKYIDEELIISRKKLANGNTEIITKEKGIDGNDDKPAIIRHTYNFSKSTFSITKDIQFVGENAWIKRNEYLYTRVQPGG